MSIPTGQTSSQAPQSVEAYGSDAAAPRSPASCGCEDRADRPGVDRVVGVPAGLPVDGADVDAGRAADAAERRPSLGIGERPRPARVEQHEVERRSARRPRARRSRATCTGSSARPSPSAAGAAGARRGRATRATTFSIPITVISVSGSVVHIRPLPSDSTTQTVPGLGDGEVRAGDRDAGAEERLAEVAARGGLGERRGIVREAGPTERARGRGRAISAGRWWSAGTSRCDGRSPASWMISSARSVSIGRDPAPRERLVEPDLVGRERLHLDDLVGARRARTSADDDLVRLGRVARPVHDAARGLTDASSSTSSSSSRSSASRP